MKKVIMTVTVEIQPGDNEKDIQAKPDKFYLTSSGVTYLDDEFKKYVSMVKSACSKFLKKKQ